MRSRPLSASTTTTVADVEGVRGRLQDRAGDLEHVLAQRLAGLQRRLAADAGGARRPGAAAVGRVVGVAGDDANALDRHAEGGRDDLRGDRLGALALLGDARLADDRAGGVEPHRHPVLRGDARAADAVEGGARVGHLDEAGEADAAMNALVAQARLLGAQRRVIHHAEELVERGVMRQGLELEPRGRVGRIGVVRDEVTAPDLDRIHADLAGREIHEPFGDRAGDRMADGPVLAHDVLVLEDDTGAGAVAAAGIGPADQVDDLVGLDGAGARIHGIRDRCR